MASTLYPTLRASLKDVAATIQAQRETQYPSPPPSVLPPIPPEELQPLIEKAWKKSWQGYTNSQSQDGSSAAELVRSILDLVGRDLTVSAIQDELPEPLDGSSPLEQSSFQTNLSDRLDITLTLYELVYNQFPKPTLPTSSPSPLEPGAIFIPLLEELVELLSVESWRTLWNYVETRSKRFTKDMPASKGKALPLLRTINAFLRFLPRTPEDLVFRGRVHQFASGVISVADKSAINMRGDYNDIKTTWDQDSPGGDGAAINGNENGNENDGDVKMEVDDTKSVEEEKSIKDNEQIKQEPESKFYETLWSLQQYFAHPPSLDGPPLGTPPQSPFDQFKLKSDYVLPKLFEQTVKEKEMMGKEAVPGVSGVGAGGKRKREGESTGGFFHPRYLTGKRLLEHELADPSFRRQILVQYFILFQFLLNLTPSSVGKQAFTGGMPKTFVIAIEDETWVKGKVASIREELRKMMPDGPRFEETVLSIITRERHYAQWKNEGCPESVFEIPPLDNTSALESAELWKRRLAPPPSYPFRLGSRPLSKLWNRGFRDIDQLKRWKRKTTYQSLEAEISGIEEGEEDDKAMGRQGDVDVLAMNADIKLKATWRALRLASQTEIRHFSALAKSRDIHILVKAIKEAELAAAKPIVENVEPPTEDAKSEDGEAGEEAPIPEKAKDVDRLVEDEKMVVRDEVPDGDAIAEEKGDEGEVVKEEVEVEEVPKEQEEESTAPAGEVVDVERAEEPPVAEEARTKEEDVEMHAE